MRHLLVVGTFAKNKYQLTYKVDGADYKSYEMEYDAPIIPEAEPTKEGYTFSGWSEIPKSMPADDVTITGTFAKNKYQLTYKVDGANYKSYEMEFDAPIIPEAEPTKEGYTFSGWSEIPETMPADDVTITGTFAKNKYQLIYIVDGAYYKSYEMEYDAPIIPEAEPTKEGYTFSGWSEIPETMPADGVIITGTFIFNESAEAVSLDKSEVVVRKNKTVTLKATVSPETLTDKSVTWKSSDTKIATVTNDGKVKGVKTGTVTITCTSVATGAKATCKVTVATITLNISEVTIKKGNTLTLTPTVYPLTLEDKSVTWKSSDTKIATVTSDGMVKGINAGTATITCTSVATGLSTTGMVTVSGVHLDKSEVVVRKNKTVTMTPTIYPLTQEDKSVTWKSSDKTIATVTSSGKVKGVKCGTATITCTSVATGEKATCKVTVGTITLNKSEVILKKNKTVTLTPTVYPTTLADKSVTWKSSDKKIATVTSSGKVKGVKTGIVTITCTSVATGLSTTCTVTVGTITLNISEVTIKKGNTMTLTPTVYPTTLEDKSVTWKTSDKTVATVTSAGKVTGVKAGTATITCTSVATGLSTTCKVTVSASASARALDGDDDEVTGIENLDEMPAVEEPFDVYDLQGRKVLHQVTSLEGLPAGVYIVNGKKMLKK